MNYYYFGREYQYHNITPRIIIEELLLDSKGNIPLDYKFFCYRGETKFIQVDLNRFNQHKRAFYDTDWNKIPVKLFYPSYNKEIPSPKGLKQMISIAKTLSRNLNFVRVENYFSFFRFI